jgi:hypothetical protein
MRGWIVIGVIFGILAVLVGNRINASVAERCPMGWENAQRIDGSMIDLPAELVGRESPYRWIALAGRGYQFQASVVRHYAPVLYSFLYPTPISMAVTVAGSVGALDDLTVACARASYGHELWEHVATATHEAQPAMNGTWYRWTNACCGKLDWQTGHAVHSEMLVTVAGVRYTVDFGVRDLGGSD